MTSTTASELLATLRQAGARLWEEDGALRYRAPKGVVGDEEIRALREHKAELLECLRAEDASGALVADPAARHEPFPLTDVQSAYLLGRNEAFEYGGVACHVYLEVNYPDLEPDRVEEAWNLLIQRHDMLRAVVDPDGHQRVLRDVPRLEISVSDLRTAEARGSSVEDVLERAREEMGHRVYDTTRWPLFDVRLTRTAERAVLHLSVDFLIADWASIWLLLAEFERLHDNPAEQLPAVQVQFRDYLLAERGLRESDAYQRDRAYWSERIDALPPAPDLPLLDGGESRNARADSGPPRFRRRFLTLGTSSWERFKERAQQRGLTPSSAVLAAYAATVERWSRSSRFCLNLTVLNRLPLHPGIDGVVGDFTSVDLLAVDWQPDTSFGEQTSTLAAQLFDDLDHRLYSGVEVLRELARRKGREHALMPVVFTSAIGLGTDGTGGRAEGELDGFGITQTPQVFIDCQAMDNAHGLQINWDVREGVFPDGLVDDMFTAFESLIERLADTDEAWDTQDGLPLPDWQRRERDLANATSTPLPEALLHETVLAQAARTPDRAAVLSPQGTLTYGELAGRTRAVAAALRAGGCVPGDRVAILMEKGPEQVPAVLGTLLAGGVYLPVDPDLPALRRAALLTDAGARHVLTQSWTGATGTDEASVIAVDTLAPDGEPVEPVTEAGPDDPAYVIYTSGSTGRPKGVVVSHRAALNTLTDINERFALSEGDRVLGLAQLSFDLSVFDLFGPLSVGAALVLPDAERRTDPSHWAELIRRHGVTVWDSVPALMQMLVAFLDAERDDQLPTMRLVLLSGDWVPTTLPGQVTAAMPQARTVSLGGATEAAIWSIHHVCDGAERERTSVPYGTPLSNQGFRVLDPAMRDRPVWTPGELYISGAGLALEYLGDAETTAHRFVLHPHDGERLYRTGDLGRYLPGGEIEFLGREDTQVKVRGHRIELGEIESALLDHPAVAAAGAVVDGEGDSRALLAVVETAPDVQPDGTAPLAELRGAVGAAADAAVPEVERTGVRERATRFDDAVLTSMAYALGRLGLPPSGEAPADALLDKAGIDRRHHWLVRRWYAVLTERGILDADARTVERRWAEAEKAWNLTEGSAAFLAYVRANTAVLPELLTGRQDPVALLFPDGALETADALYRHHAMAHYLNRAVATLLENIARSLPPQSPPRVLEVGAGTGATTEGALEVLAAEAGEAGEYLFTDAAPFFLPEARRRFGERPGMRFGVFDVDTEPRAQGLAPNAHDVVLAAGVLENARDIPAALARLALLTAPGGWLVITEPTREHPWVLASQAFMMTEPEDSRSLGGSSYHDRDAWIDLLTRAGAEEVLCLPEDGHDLDPHGMHLFAARLKTDRAHVTESELAAFLAERLPAHMIPSHLQIADRLPLTANGKVDRRTLREWRPAATEEQRRETAEPPANALETRLGDLWGTALSAPGIGRHDSFYDHGADSLIMARMAGRLREELPEAREFPFEQVLRHLLNHPTIAQLAAYLESAADRSDAVPALPHAGGGNAALLPFSSEGEGPLRVLFHAGLGTMDCYRPLAARLVAQDLGPVIGVVIDDTERYCAADPATVVERAADDYAERLAALGHDSVQLVGYCLGGLYATEVARRLDERGIEVADLILISSHPVVYDVEDDLMIEILFVPNLHISLEQTAFGGIDGDLLTRGFMDVLARNDGKVPAGSLAEVGGDADLDRAGDYFRSLSRWTRRERFAEYARAAGAADGREMPVEMVESMFTVFRQSFLAARFTPPPYAGDVRFLLPRGESGFAPGMDETTLDFWRDVCLGDLPLTAIEGNHFSCIEEPHVAHVADLVSSPLRTAAPQD
ncbi:non-ribosomal peptide synthetase [Streptomyces sulphureus]|uniref:non-ribosomal peptide synthetase n=1 Tax=Streptomyces sulphureus TaxID=47758 RepID=UPI00037554FD|nr:non-ribosomal peptide synthetase [Streptomyces sulphureus]